MLDILEMRAFARAKEEVDAYDPKGDPERENAPKGALIELVEEIKWRIVEEALRGGPDG